VSSYSLYFAIAIASKSLYIYISLFTNPSYIKNIYLTLLFLVDSLLALYFAKYSLNHLSTCCVLLLLLFPILLTIPCILSLVNYCYIYYASPPLRPIEGVRGIYLF
jgi:hypothetical protein